MVALLLSIAQEGLRSAVSRGAAAPAPRRRYTVEVGCEKNSAAGAASVQALGAIREGV